MKQTLSTQNRNLLSDYGLTQRDLRSYARNRRINRLMDRNGIVTESQSQRAFPGFNRNKYERRFGSRRVHSAERLLGDLSRYGASASVLNLRESIGPDLFDELITDSMNASLAAMFQTQPVVFEPIVNIVEVSDFQDQTVVIMGQLEDIADLDKTGGVYQEISPPSDNKVTFSVALRGNRLVVDFKTLKNDTLGYFNNVAQELGKAMSRRLNEFVLGENLEDNPTIDDGNSLFDNTNHVNDPNTGSTVALNYANLETAWKALRGQVDRDSKPVSWPNGAGFYILTGTDNELQAEILAESDNNPDNANEQPNVLRKRIHGVITYDNFDSSSAWYLVASPMDLEGYRLGYLQGMRTPVFEDLGDDPTGETDNHIWRIKQGFGGEWVNWQAIVRGSA